MSNFIKAERVVSTALGLLLRELVLPRLVWRDAAGDFAGAKGDTISIRLPAYAPARKRALRSGAARTKDSLHERKVDVTLATDIYKDVPIKDEELTLDIADFGGQVLNPVLVGIAMQLEQEVADLIRTATYQNVVNYTGATDDVYKVAVSARKLLNNNHVPFAGRVLLVGSDVESDFLNNDKFNRADTSGSDQTLREATIGRVAGFDVVTSSAVPAAEAYAFHRTAYVMSSRAPIVPAGAPWGATQSYQGFAVRTVRVFDPDAVEDRFVADAWVGTNVVRDTGHYDADPAAGGKFVPVTDPDNPITGQANAWANDTARLVRAVKLTRS